MKAYCVKCKVKREIVDPQAVFTAQGRPAMQGRCAVCGTSIFRLGETEAHKGLTPPKVEVEENKRKGKLVIVESPAKARTVGRFLGKAYMVKASIGHVRDLLRSQLSVDVENDFAPKYRVPNEKRPVVKELKGLASRAEEVYLATDPDREGEAIAWHLIEAADIDPHITRRVVFHEITEQAVAEAFRHTRGIDMNLVNAQQARRILDRLVGYNLSPLLWRKVRSRLSAGRVQSVALRLIVEREREIQNFVPEEYWTIAAELQPEDKEGTYIAKLVMIDNEKFEAGSETEVKPLAADMETAEYRISSLKRGERRKRPAAPFITSTMQQEASRKLGYTAKRTMAIAQQLYEGLDVGEGGSVGLITYMRTDSTQVSSIAQNEARKYILERHGEAFLPPTPPFYKTKTRGAQEAHEAIRPTSVFRTPQAVKPYLNRDQYRLYEIIWQRFVASQMVAAVFDTLTVEVSAKSSAHTYLLRASGSRMLFPGYLVIYGGQLEEQEEEEEQQRALPEGLEEGQLQRLIRLITEQHFTQPPPRYSDASLIQALEANGIGRPSTYAPILATLLQRGYVIRENRRLVPTEVGFVVNDLLIEHFPEVLDIGFTAQMETDLDRIAEGEVPWVKVVRDFYEPFARKVEAAEVRMPEQKMDLEPIGRDCPKCGHPLVIRWGRFGKFISCSNFPACRYTEAWLEKIGVLCPQDGGDIVERKTRRGRIFYGCINYPACDFTSWKKPLPTPCPDCGGMLVVANKNQASCMQCERTFSLNELSFQTEASPAFPNPGEKEA